MRFGRPVERVVHRLVMHLVEEPRVADGRRRLTGQGPQQLGLALDGAEPVGVVRHRRDDEADRLAVDGDRYAHARDRSGAGHQRSDQLRVGIRVVVGDVPVTVGLGHREGQRAEEDLVGVLVADQALDVAVVAVEREQDDRGAIAVDQPRDGSREPRGDLLDAPHVAERRGEVEQDLRCVGVPAGLVQCSRGVERGRREVSERGEGGLTVRIGDGLVAPRDERAVPLTLRHEVHADRGRCTR